MSKKITLSVLISALMVVGCSSAEEKVAKYVSKGQEYLAAGDLTKARIEFQNALQIEPNKLDAISALADIAERSGDWQRLYGLLAKVAELDAKNPKAHVRLARLLLAAGDLKRANESVSAALVLSPNDPDVMTLQAALLLKGGDGKGAADWARKALKQNPKQADALVVLATERMQQKDPTQALVLLDQALALNPKDMGVSLIKVQAHEELQQLDQAEAVLRKLVADAPGNPAYRKALAYFYLSHKQSDKAIAELRALAAANPKDTKAQLDVVSFVASTQGKEAARAELNRLIAADGKNDEYRFALGELLTLMGKAPEAAKVYEAIIEKADVSQEGTRARGALARIKLAQGDKAGTAALVAEILKRDARNEDGLLLQATLDLDAGKREEAIAGLRTILRDIPNSGRAHLMLARAHDLEGAKDLALDHFGRAWNAKKSAQYGVPYAEYLLRVGKPDQAPDVLKEVLRLEPDNTQATRLLAQAYIGTGDLAAAQALADSASKSNDQANTATVIQAAIFEAQQNYNSSIQAFRKAYEAAPAEAQPIAALVSSYLRAGKTREAQDFLQSVLNASPENTSARLLLAQLQASSGKREAALSNYEAVLSKDSKNTEAYAGLMRLHQAAGNSEAALKTADRGLAAVPGDVGLRIIKAGLLELANRVDDAIKLYDELLRDRPNSEVVANNLASLLADFRTDKASHERAYQLAQRFKSSDVPYFIDTYGWASHKVGRSQEAVIALKKAVEKQPDLAAIQYHYGMVQLSMNNKALARTALSKAVELGKTQPFPQMAEVQKILQTL